MEYLITALKKIIGVNGTTGSTFLKSGNLLNKLQDLGEEASKEVADSHYERTAKEKETYEKGYLLGRINKTKKPVYRIEYPPNIYYFIGTEADILRKISKYEEENKSKENVDENVDTDAERKDQEQTMEELTELFK